MTQWIQHRDHIGALLWRTVNQATRVQGGIAPVRADFVMEIALRARPIPDRDDHIALDPLWARWHSSGQLAGGYAVSPIGKFFKSSLRVEAAYGIDHLHHGLAGLDAPLPGLDRGFESSERWGNGARRAVAELMAGEAAIGLDDVKPSLLALDATDAATLKFALIRHLEHRKPVDCGKILGRRSRVGCRNGGQIEPAARNGGRLRRVGEPIAAHPDAVVGAWERRNKIAAVVVGHDDLNKLGRKVSCFSNDPNPRF